MEREASVSRIRNRLYRRLTTGGLSALLLLPLVTFAAEKKFDFSELNEGQQPPGFRSTVTGQGKPGKWAIVLDDAPAPAGLTLPGKSVFKRPVLAQLAEDPTDEHFPLLIYDDEVYSDFTLTTKFKTVRGKEEQMAGIAFRIQNETNYYVVRASSLGNTFRFYRIVDGARAALYGPDVPIPAGVWHELTIQCKGSQITCGLDGKELITLTEEMVTVGATVKPLMNGKVGYWTKSDSVSYFADTKITYVAREAPAQTIVADILEQYPRLLDVKIYVPGDNGVGPRLIATKKNTETNRPPGEAAQVLSEGSIYYGRDKGYAAVTMPLRDRNGNIIAAARVVMKSFRGQMEVNAIAKATPIVKKIQSQVQSISDLVE